MRKRGRTDAQHKEIVNGLRQIGCCVLDLSSVGSGCPDLLVYRPGRMLLLEVKSPRGELTPDQQAFALRWPVHVVRSVDEALRVVLR